MQVAQSGGEGRELLQALAADASANSYARVGQFYLERGEAPCARFTFQNAVSKDGGLSQAHYGLGLALLQLGQPSEAVEELHRVLEQAPQDPKVHNALGLGFEALRDYGSAEREFKTALDLDPKFDMACFNLAHVLGAQAKYPAVVFYLEKAVALAPKQPAYRLALGTAYLASGDYESAIRSLHELLVSAPDTSAGYFQLGNAYLKQGNPEMAAQNYHRALRLDPQNDTARMRLGEALLTGGKNAQAVAVLREYSLRHPKDFQAYYLLGRAYRNLNKLGEAREALQETVRIKPDDYEARYELGLVLERLDLLEPAKEQLEAAAGINPEESKAHYELSKVLRNLNQGVDGNQEFQKFLELEAKDRNRKAVPALHAQALAAMKQGDANRAIGLYRDALKLDSRDPQLQYDFALALGENGNRHEQEFQLQRALQLDPNLAGAHHQLALLYMDEGKTGAAEGEFTAALSVDPQYYDAQVALAILYAKDGKEQKAETLFRQAIESNPKSGAGYANLGLLLAKLGRDVEAEQELQRAARIMPHSPDVLLALANLQSKAGRPVDSICTLTTLAEHHDESAQTEVELGVALAADYSYDAALEAFSNAVRLAPNSALPRLYKGRTLYDIGRLEDARHELQSACSLSSGTAACWYLLALVERQSGNLPLSTKYLETVLKLEPQNGDAEFVLGQSWSELGRQKKALQYWQAALQASPDQSRSLYALAQAFGSSRDSESRTYQDRLQETARHHHVSDRIGLLSRLAQESALARDWSAAILQYQKALSECNHCDRAPELRSALGITYCQTGRLDSAEKELRMTLELKPNDTGTLQTLEQIRAVMEARQNGSLSVCAHTEADAKVHSSLSHARR